MEADGMDVWKNRVQDDISELKNNQAQIRNEQINMKSDIADLRMNDRLQDQEIKTLKDALFEIKDDTNWIRRKITGAIITAAVTAVVAGIIGVAITKIYGG
ncbi:hemolysin XhlA family protein [Siminovitchia fortis]|uniref:Hemolysin XhlA n=1 Tax=Siminovitchia fortis TaxID=254758 RepID=A0A443IN00_9BACI|nr:hemolysin XhlA family protein [Siminovitchia fortis]RWR06760.1 hypothetical protein D4N35_013930 [Siminovitchia fortis]WHY83029.1 hemolysin XhlA family protein [Siminovitchia fortis]